MCAVAIWKPERKQSTIIEPGQFAGIACRSLMAFSVDKVLEQRCAQYFGLSCCDKTPA